MALKCEVRWGCVFFLAGCAAGGAYAEPASVTSAEALLQAAVANQYQGDYACEVVWVENSFVHGIDSLDGRAVFADSEGVRNIRLENRNEAYEWWSRDFGQVQWWKNDRTERLHRVPFHSFKKPAFGTLFTYEDLAEFPAGYLRDPQACQKLGETDSAYTVSVWLKPSIQSRYGYLEVTLQKSPVLLRRVVFFSPEGKRLKSLEAGDYRPEDGKYLPGAIRVVEGDSLASVRVSLRHPQAAPLLAGAAKPAASAPQRISSVTGDRALAPAAADAADAEEADAPAAN